MAWVPDSGGERSVPNKAKQRTAPELTVRAKPRKAWRVRSRTRPHRRITERRDPRTNWASVNVQRQFIVLLHVRFRKLRRRHCTVMARGFAAFLPRTPVE